MALSRTAGAATANVRENAKRHKQQLERKNVVLKKKNKCVLGMTTQRFDFCCYKWKFCRWETKQAVEGVLPF